MSFLLSPQGWPLSKDAAPYLATLRLWSKTGPRVHNGWKVFCKSCTYTGGEVQLHSDTHGVTVSSQDAQTVQVTKASANLSHLAQSIQFRGIEGAEALVAHTDPVTVTDTVAGLHWANVVCRFIELLFSYVSKM